MNRKIILSTLIALGMVVGTVSPAYALYFSDLTGNTLTFDGTDTVMLDFNKGGSDIRDDGNMWFNTDDSIYLHAPTSVVFWSDTIQFWPDLTQPTLDFNKGGSQIYDDGDLFIKTDDNIYLQGTTIAKGTVRPDADDTYDLGSATKEWQDLYVDGTANLDTASVSGNLTVGGTITGTATVTTLNVTGATTLDGAVTLGDATGDDITVTGYVASSVIPKTDDTYDLGSATREWKDLYVDGVVYLDGVSYDGTLITADAGEINILDGVTATATELNLLDGVGASMEDLNATTNFEETLSSTTTVLTVTDGAIDFDVASHDGTNGLKLGGVLVTKTAAQINALADGTLDDAYDAFGATASKITVDAAESQTGGLEFESSGAVNTIFDLQGTGDLIVQDAGTAAWTFDDGGDLTGAADEAFTAAGDVDFTEAGGASGTADFDVAGYAQFAGTVELDGAADLDSTLDVDGATTLNGAVTLGDATGDDITVTGYVASSLLPKTDATYDLGSSGQQWNDLYINGVAYVDAFGQDATPDSDAGWDLGSSTVEWKDLYVDGVAYLDGVGEHLLPSSADAVNLGATDKEWAYLYLGDNATALQFSTAQDVTVGADLTDDAFEIIIDGTNVDYVSIGESANMDHMTASDGDLLVVGEFEANGAAWFDGALTLGGVSTFNSDVDLVLAGSETMTITHTAVTTADTLAIDVTTSGAGTANGVVITGNSAGTDPVDVALDISAEDTSDNMGIGARIQAAASATIDTALQILAGAGGAVTTAIDVSDAEVVTALSFGDNPISGDYFDVNADGLTDITGGAGTSGDLFDITRANDATAGDAIDIDMGNAAQAGDAIDILYGSGAATGNAIEVDMGSNVAGAVLNASVAGARSDAVIEIADSGTGSEPVIDVNMSGIHTGNVLDITFASAAATDNAIDLNMGTNVAGQAVDIASAGTGEAATGAGINIAHTGVLGDGDASVVRVDSSGAHSAAASLVDLSSTGNLATAVADGAVLKVEETGAAQATTYAVYISSTSNEALHVDTGLSVFDEAIHADGGIDRSSAAALAIGATNANAVTITPATTINNTLTTGSDGTGYTVTFYSDTAGDTMVWDDTAGSIELTITGTDGVDALVIGDGNVNFSSADDVSFPASTVAAADIANIVRTIQLPLFTWRTDANPPLAVVNGTTPNTSDEGNFDTIEWGTGETTQKITNTLTVPVTDYASGLELHFITAHDGATDDDESVGLDWYNAKTGEADNPTVVDEGATSITYAQTLNEGTIAMDGGTIEADDILRLVFGFDAIDETVHLVATWLEYTATQ